MLQSALFLVSCALVRSVTKYHFIAMSNSTLSKSFGQRSSIVKQNFVENYRLAAIMLDKQEIKICPGINLT